MTDWTKNDDIVTVLLAGDPRVTQVWLATFQTDSRYRITTLASTADDLRLKLNTHPEAVLIHAEIFSSAEHCLQEVSRINDAIVYVVLPQLHPDEAQAVEAELRSLPTVQDVYPVDVHLPTLLERMYGDARRSRQEQQSAAPVAWKGAGGGNGRGVQATTIVAVWNQMGGVGKTTISSNLAAMSAKRNVATLLIGLGAPDNLPIILGLPPEPNINHFRANPSVEGLKQAVQKLGALDVLAGFPDTASANRCLNADSDAPDSLAALIGVALRAGYASIIVDAPSDNRVAQILAGCNALVLVGHPSTDGIYRTMEGFRTVTERLRNLHSIPDGRIYCVLNRQTGDRFDQNTWHRMVTENLGRPFPPLITEIPELAAVGQLQDEHKLPIDHEPRLAAALEPLAEALFGGNGRSLAATRSREKVLRLGPIVIRV